MKYFLVLLIPVLVQAAALNNVNCRYQSTITYQATASSAQVLAVNGNRKCLEIQNLSGQTIYIKPNSIHTASEGYKLANGEVWQPQYVPINAFFVETATSSGAITIFSGE